ERWRETDAGLSPVRADAMDVSAVAPNLARGRSGLSSVSAAQRGEHGTLLELMMNELPQGLTLERCDDIPRLAHEVSIAREHRLIRPGKKVRCRLDLGEVF